MDYYVLDTKNAYNFRLGNHLKTEYRKELDESHETRPVLRQNPKKALNYYIFQKIIYCYINSHGCDD